MPNRLLDAHVHAWDLDKVEYAWLKGDTSILNRTYDLDELEPQREEIGITEGIMVQAANNRADTEAMLEQCRQRDWLKGAVGWLDLLRPETLEEEIAQRKADPYFVGMRHLIHDEADPHWLLQEPVVQSFGFLEKHRIPYDVVAVRAEHRACVLKLSEKYPDQNWCLDHLAHPPAATRERFGVWGEQMKALASHPRICIKISGLGMCTADKGQWTVEELKPYLHTALELFGPERAFLGGDWPVVELCGGYKKSWKAYLGLLEAWLRPGEFERVRFRNGLRFYGLSS